MIKSRFKLTLISWDRSLCARTRSLAYVYVCMEVSSVCLCVLACSWCSCVCTHVSDVSRCMCVHTGVALLPGVYVCPCSHVPGTCALCDVHVSLYTCVWMYMMWRMQIVHVCT